VKSIFQNNEHWMRDDEEEASNGTEEVHALSLSLSPVAHVPVACATNYVVTVTILSPS
jgi:hypothetical protein